MLSGVFIPLRWIFCILTVTMGSIFKFKQFEVDQSDCAMKINTDGVLLAAYVTASAPQHILDVGTGTGVIAMMLAQRFPDAQVDAVEIDAEAANRAALNFTNSAFAPRIMAHHVPVAEYQTTRKYDLVVSNPPYFVNDLKNPEQRKGVARHADETFFESLLERVAGLLTEEGAFWLILPVKQAEWMINHAPAFKLYLTFTLDISSDVQKPVIRQVICLSRRQSIPDVAQFYIYASEGVYTDAYKYLLKDFFLAF